MDYTVKRHVDLNLRCLLDLTEVRERGEELARVRTEISREKASAREDAKTHKEVLEELEERSDELRREINERATHREVKCEIRLFQKEGLAYTVRLDTEEIVSRRPLELSERQGDLFPVGVGRDERVESDEAAL